MAPDYYAEKYSRRAQIILERLSAEQAGGIYPASGPAGPAVPNRFIHLSGSGVMRTCPSSAVLRSAEFIPLRLGAD